MIEHFAEFIPESVRHRNGRVFYSGRKAFSAPSHLYVLGINPGGDPVSHPGDTVHRHTTKVMNRCPDNWSAYRDERWKGQPGTSGIQPSLLHLFKVAGYDPGTVPASNVLFLRSRNVPEYPGNTGDDARQCWAFHQEVIDRLSVEVVVVAGRKQERFIRDQLKADELVESWTDGNKKPWRSTWHRNRNGLSVVVLAHPSRGHEWTRPASDPTGLVTAALND